MCIVMRKSWLDPEDSQTEIYLGPPVRPQGTAPVQLARATGPALVASDLLEIPSLAYAVGSTTRPHSDERPLLTPVTFALAALCVVVGVTLGSVIGVSDHSSTSMIANAAGPARVAAAPVVTVRPIVTPLPVAPAPLPPTTLRVESTPPGATVMFVADSATTLVGTTPIDTNIDPQRTYDVLVTLANHASRIEHVIPSWTITS